MNRRSALVALATAFSLTVTGSASALSLIHISERGNSRTPRGVTDGFGGISPVTAVTFAANGRLLA